MDLEESSLLSIEETMVAMGSSACSIETSHRSAVDGVQKYCLFVGLSTSQHIHSVTFEWNVLLDLSGGAATKTFRSLVTKLLLQVLGKSTW